MIMGSTMTAQEAVNLHTVAALVGRQCVVVGQVLGNGEAKLIFGEIVDPEDCIIDEPQGELLCVEYHENDDWHLELLQPEAPLVLLEVAQ